MLKTKQTVMNKNIPNTRNYASFEMVTLTWRCHQARIKVFGGPGAET